MSEKTAVKGKSAAKARPATFIDARRRGFLQGAAVAGGAAAVGPAVAGPRIDEAERVTENAPVSSGYRETDHVREYYAKARF